MDDVDWLTDEVIAKIDEDVKQKLQAKAQEVIQTQGSINEHVNVNESFI